MKNRINLAITVLCFVSVLLSAQQQQWTPDLGNGMFKNPIIYADYSDPDVIRVGENYYMTSSSFASFPGLPILTSKDLVNWQIIGHAIQNYPYPEFDKPQHGNAVWAPSIRFHKGEFYIYFGDPDRGIFMTKSKNPAKSWSPLKLVKQVKGWIDCCPLWDEDGQVYLVHAYANSRCGIKSKLAVARMNEDGTEVIGNDSIVFDGTINHPTLEGPKFYKRNGYYYILAPAGGVKPGWQVAFRSKNVYGPYEDKIVQEQGSTNVNGPHQGGWVTSPDGKDWFLHFQDRYAYGRIVHLQPMKWVADWPVMGIDYDKNGIGEPVGEFNKPQTSKKSKIQNPQTSDDFNQKKLGLQWQWESNFKKDWYSLTQKPGSLRLYSETDENIPVNLWTTGRLLLQKFPAEVFSVTTKVTLPDNHTNNKSGLIIFGEDYAYIAIQRNSDSIAIVQVNCINANNGKPEQIKVSKTIENNTLYFRVDVKSKDQNEIVPTVLCSFSYSPDGNTFTPFGEKFKAREGHWIGAKVGIFSTSNTKNNYADYDFFHISVK